MSSAPGVTGTQPNERPERSRNAKAQARHRAKRKAYIEQLEQTVTKLQTAMGFTPEQVAALPPPLAKIRELEQENARLLEENEKLRRLLQDGRSVSASSLDFGTRARGLGAAGYDGRCVDRNGDYTKRRKLSAELDNGPVYGLSSDPTTPNDLLSRAPPPPLTIPQQPPQHHYTNHGSHTPHSAHPSAIPHPSSLSHHSSHSSHPSPHPSNHSNHPHASPPTSGTGSMFHLHTGAFTMPPSTPSSSTSSPPFSASVIPSSF
ncbi:hypothetical protein PQX77_000857 [Marasmius sp. AFHP31]|nr:hypothetical protein PQX77_000857 [Marasmius sp. AFHP31]